MDEIHKFNKYFKFKLGVEREIVEEVGERPRERGKKRVYLSVCWGWCVCMCGCGCRREIPMGVISKVCEVKNSLITK